MLVVPCILCLNFADFVIIPPHGSLIKTTCHMIVPLSFIIKLIVYLINLQSAHMAVTEAIMTLYIKEVVTGDRIANAVRRLRDVSKSSIGGQSAHDVEEALVIWINQSCSALTQMIADTKVRNHA